MTDPFLKYGDMLRADYGEAIRLQALVLHLFNSTDWPVDLPCLLRSTDEQRNAARAMTDWYAEKGESDGVFMEVARRLARQNLERRGYIVSWGCACGSEPGWYGRVGRRPYLACTRCDEPVRPPVELD